MKVINVDELINKCKNNRPVAVSLHKRSLKMEISLQFA